MAKSPFAYGCMDFLGWGLCINSCMMVIWNCMDGSLLRGGDGQSPGVSSDCPEMGEKLLGGTGSSGRVGGSPVCVDKSISW